MKMSPGPVRSKVLIQGPVGGRIARGEHVQLGHDLGQRSSRVPPERVTITALGDDDDPDLAEADFWSLIDLLAGTADGVGRRRLILALNERGTAEIDGFSRLMDAALAMLDTDEHLDPPTQAPRSNRDCQTPGACCK